MKRVILLLIILVSQIVYGQVDNYVINDESPRIYKVEENNNFLNDTMIRMRWIDDSWVNDLMWENHYNESNLIFDVYIYESISNEWEPRTHVVRIYDDRNNIEYFEEYWQDSIWINLRRYVKTFDDNNNLIYWEYQVWKDSLWQTLNRNYITLDAQNNRIEDLTENWVDGNWVKYSRKNYFYSEDLLTESVFKLWIDSMWINSSKRLYHYDLRNLLIQEAYEIWDNDWQNDTRIIYSYDEAQNLTNSLKEKWSNEQWENYEHKNYSYDADNNNTEILCQRWADGSWINFFKDIMTYIPITSFKNRMLLSTEFRLSQNYPNPFNPTTTIKYSIPNVETLHQARAGQVARSLQSFNVELKIYDVLGKEVITIVNQKQKSGNYEVEFDGSELTSGIYFYRLQGGDFENTKKMILLK